MDVVGEKLQCERRWISDRLKSMTEIRKQGIIGANRV